MVFLLLYASNNTVLPTRDKGDEKDQGVYLAPPSPDRLEGTTLGHTGAPDLEKDCNRGAATDR